MYLCDRILVWTLVLAHPVIALAQTNSTPGYPERVIQWTVQRGETCGQIAQALYGSPRHAALLSRYNDLECSVALPEGTTLVVPERVVDLPSARLQTLAPDVRARPAGGGWSPAAPGMPLFRNHSVNTLAKARADILFVDRTRVLLGAHTLVVIYGTADQSRVTKTPAAAVQVEEGELRAGIAALRGRSAAVAVKGGGQVTAASKDTVVRKRKKRTTVSVFDGEATVSSAGTRVKVPVNQGTAFVEAQPPTPPRPLPAAPSWVGEMSKGVLMAGPKGGTLFASWQPVDKAAVYRFEVGKDQDFSELVAREEVPSTITSFRAEQMPAGSYFLRVRAVDGEDFLGLASEVLSVSVLSVDAQGEFRPGVGTIDASPYALLRLTSDPNVEMALDEGPYQPTPASLDLLQDSPKRIRLRRKGSSEQSEFSIRYLEPSASITLAEGRLRVQLTGLDPAQLTRVQPVARLGRQGGVETLPLATSGEPGGFAATVASERSTPTRIDVVDSRGHVLGHWEPTPTPPEMTLPVAPHHWATGPCAPPVTSSPLTDISWWAPTVCNTLAVGGALDSVSGELGTRALFRMGGQLGAFGLDALLQTDVTDDTRRGDDAAVLGGRWRAVEWQRSLSLGPALRFALPPTARSAPPRLEAGLALAWELSSLTLIGDLGGRVRLASDEQRQGAPDGQGFLLLGAQFLPRAFVRPYAVLDAHALHSDDRDELRGRGGLSIGAELGKQLYGGVAGRVSPWQMAGGRWGAQLVMGVRE